MCITRPAHAGLRIFLLGLKPGNESGRGPYRGEGDATSENKASRIPSRLGGPAYFRLNRDEYYKYKYLEDAMCWAFAHSTLSLKALSVQLLILEVSSAIAALLASRKALGAAGLPQQVTLCDPTLEFVGPADQRGEMPQPESRAKPYSLDSPRSKLVRFTLVGISRNEESQELFRYILGLSLYIIACAAKDFRF